MQTNNIIGILTKVSILSLCSTSMSCQYLCMLNFSTVAGRHGRSLTTSVITTTVLNSIRSNRRLCLVPSSLPLQRKPFPSNLQSKLALLSTSTTGSASSTFQPPEPPGTKGTPIFPDIKILQPDEANRTENATRRNTDSNAVMVVTGANRGIGLQFVKSLLHHTTVRTLNEQPFTTFKNRFNQSAQLILCVFFIKNRVQSLLAVVHQNLQLICTT